MCVACMHLCTMAMCLCQMCNTCPLICPCLLLLSRVTWRRVCRNQSLPCTSLFLFKNERASMHRRCFVNFLLCMLCKQNVIVLFAACSTSRMCLLLQKVEHSARMQNQSSARASCDSKPLFYSGATAASTAVLSTSIGAL